MILFSNKTFVGRTYQINKSNNIKILKSKNSMPPKFQSANDNNTLSSNRNIYNNKAGRPSYGSDSSGYTNYLKSKAIGKSMRGFIIDKNKPINQCFGKINYNDTRKAIRKARSSGYVTPLKSQIK